MGTKTKSVLLCAALLAAAVRGASAAPRSLTVCDDVTEPLSLDPLKEFSEKYYTIIQQLFDSLVRLGPDGRLEPSLAQSWRRLDDRTIEFKLRPGVAFHDGEPFTADAVRFSLAKLSDPKGGFPGAGFLGTIEGAEVVDPLTVRIRTRVPDGILLNRLAGLVPILPPRYIAEHGMEYFGAHPVGTGTFRFEAWDHANRRLTLKANRAHWLKDSLAYDELVFRFIPQDAQVGELLSGGVDVVTELPGTETLRVMKSGVAKVVKKETFYTAASSLNAKEGPLADRRVRQALNYAVNKERLIRYDLRGNGRALGTLSMPDEPGHDPAIKPYPYDPAKARRLLKEAGYGKGFHLKALVKVQGLRAMNIIASDLARVGVTVDIDTTTDTEAVRDMTRKRWDWIFAGCPDPLGHAYFVQFIFLSSLSPFSVTGDPEYDRRLDAMARSTDPAAQEERGRELDRYVHDQALSLFTYQRVKTYGVRRGVRFVPSVTGMPYFYLTRPE